MIDLDSWQVGRVSGGRLRTDGGTMFGLVPKALWQRAAPADDRNRIAMDTNCLLVRGQGMTVLIDTGYGPKQTARQREIFDLEAGDVLVDNLRRAGVEPEQVDIVLLTHLHFDHAGGATRHDGRGEVVATFPRARHLVQRVEWLTAAASPPELGDAYPRENFLPLEQAGLVELLDGDAEIAPGLGTVVTGGHTKAHQAVLIEGGGKTLFYPADICPMRPHMRLMWNMSYDVEPLQTRRAKAHWLGRAADGEWITVWNHDAEVVAARLVRDSKTEFRIGEVLCENEPRRHGATEKS